MMDDKKLNASGISSEQSVQPNQFDSPSNILTKSAQRRARDRAKQMKSGDYDNNEDRNSDETLASFSSLIRVIAQNRENQSPKDSPIIGGSNDHQLKESKGDQFRDFVEPVQGGRLQRDPTFMSLCYNRGKRRKMDSLTLQAYQPKTENVPAIVSSKLALVLDSELEDDKLQRILADHAHVRYLMKSSPRPSSFSSSSSTSSSTSSSSSRFGLSAASLALPSGEVPKFLSPRKVFDPGRVLARGIVVSPKRSPNSSPTNPQVFKSFLLPLPLLVLLRYMILMMMKCLMCQFMKLLVDIVMLLMQTSIPKDKVKYCWGSDLSICVFHLLWIMKYTLRLVSDPSMFCLVLRMSFSF